MAIPIATKPFVADPAENYSGFSGSGFVRALSADQILRSSQAGGILDARLEIGVYHLLLDQKRTVGPWIGETVELADQKTAPGWRKRRAGTLLSPARRNRIFRKALPGERADFLQVREGHYEEIGPDGRIVAAGVRELAVPRDYSTNMISVLPVFRHEGKVYVGLEKRQLPSVQMHDGTSDLTTGQSFRLPREIKTMDEGKAYVQEQMKQYFGTTSRRVWELGGAYHSSSGVSPETVYPVVMEIDAASQPPGDLQWVELGDLLRERRNIRDGNLTAGAFRLGHALGLLR
jgi:hypothetical protein